MKRKKKRKKPLVYIWTGSGAGKTTSALGVALRQAGHKQKSVIIQFMKGRKNIGEYMAIKSGLKPYCRVYQFGRPGWVNLRKPAEMDKRLAKKGLDFVSKIAKKRPNLLVLDEILIAVKIGLLDERDVLKAIDKIPANVVVYMTGRYATKSIRKRADYITEFITRKMPKRNIPKKGIDY